MSDKTILSISDLSVHYGKHMALNIDRTINIEYGDRVGIIGNNGAGKTTLLKALLGIIPSEGTININRNSMAVHMQENNYTHLLRVDEIMETILGKKVYKDKKAMELVEFFNFQDCLKKKYQHLSGGQKQKLTLILVLSQDSELVFFDEVTTGLDFVTRQELISLLKTWYQGKNTTICYVTHYYQEIENLANKLLMLDNGRLIDFGERSYLFNKYCGNGIILISNTEKNADIVSGFKRITGTDENIVLSFDSSDEEIEIVKKLSEHNINYKRSNEDIEVLYINAKKAWEDGQNENI